MNTTRASERYVLGPAIAEGGMGSVHVARVRGVADFSRIVAIKRMHRRLAEEHEFVTMFLDEARMSARIRHANVVQTLDVLEADEELWIVMEYVAGASLSRLASEIPVPPAIALRVFGDALAGLDAAHRATDANGALLGLVHRDMSPHNILVGVDGVARIADFGIAKAKNRENVSLTGQFKGKVAYAAPETLRGKPATVASDLWSTGVTLWEALVGRSLFAAESHALMLFRIMESPPRPVSSAAPHLGTAFDDVVARALTSDPTKRFASAREMLEALEGCGRPASAREVAAWVEETAPDDLQLRAGLVRAMELGGLTPATGMPALGAPTVSAVGVSLGGEPLLGAVGGGGTLPSGPAPQPNVTVPYGLPLPHVPPPEPSDTAVAPARMFVQPQTPTPANIPPRVPEKRSWIGMTIASITAAAVVAFTVYALLVLAKDDTPRAPYAPPPNATAGASESTEPSASPSIAIAPPSTPSTIPSALPSGHPARPVRPIKPPSTATTAAPPSCDPPYTVDAVGDKHYRQECFRR